MSNQFRKIVQFPLGAQSTKTSTLANEFVPLHQVQSLIAGNVSVKEAVAVHGETNIDIATGGLIVLENYQLIDGDRVLLEAQTDPIENGIYVASAGSWSRAEDADEESELPPYTSVTVIHGDHAGLKFRLFNTTAPVVGTDAQNWSVSSASSSAASDTTLDQTNFDVITGATVQDFADSVDDAIQTAQTDAANASSLQLTNNIRNEALLGTSDANLGFVDGIVSDDSSILDAIKELSTHAENNSGRVEFPSRTLTSGAAISFTHNLNLKYLSGIKVFEAATGEDITHTVTIIAVDNNSLTVQNDDVDVDVIVACAK